MRATLILLLALASLLALWAFWEPTREHAEPTGRGARAGVESGRSDEPVVDPSTPGLDRATSLPERLPVTGTATTQPLPADPTPDAATATTWILRGSVEGLGEWQAKGRVLIRSADGDSSAKTVSLASNDLRQFELDFSALMPAAAPEAKLRVIVEGGNFYADPLEFDPLLEHHAASSTQGETRTVSVIVPAVGAACVVGRVPVESENRRVKVALLETFVDGPPAVIDLVELTGGGEFRLRSRRPIVGAVCAIAETRRPTTKAVTTVCGVEIDIGTVELDVGAHIAGILDGESVQPAALKDTRIMALHEGVREPSDRVQIGGEPYAWRGGKVELYTTIAAVNADGSFRIVGLADQTYRLSAMSAVTIRCGLPGAAGLNWFGIHAPTEDILLQTTATQFLVSVQFDDRDTEVRGDLKVRVLEGPEQICECNASARQPVVISVLPNRDYELAVTLDGVIRAQLAPGPLAEGERRELQATIQRDADLASLSVVLETDSPNSIPSCQFVFMDLTKPASRPFSRMAYAKDGKFIVSHLPVGDYRIGVTADGGPYVTAYRDCRLQPGQTSHLSFAAELGGTLSVQVVTPGRQLDAIQVTLIDDNGRETRIGEFALHSDAAPRPVRVQQMSSLGDDHDGYYSVLHALKPGVYRVRIVSGKDVDEVTSVNVVASYDVRAVFRL